MSDALIDYIVRPDGAHWSVCKRSLDLATTWLRSTRISTHSARDEAVAAMSRMNSGKIAAQHMSARRAHVWTDAV